MKKIYWLPLAILLLSTTAACKTTEYIEVPVEYSQEDFAAIPVRITQEQPKTVKDLGNMIIYYEDMVQEWESFGISVYETLEIPLPENLKAIKDDYTDKKNEDINNIL